MLVHIGTLVVVAKKHRLIAQRLACRIDFFLTGLVGQITVILKVAHESYCLLPD